MVASCRPLGSFRSMPAALQLWMSQGALQASTCACVSQQQLSLQLAAAHGAPHPGQLCNPTTGQYARPHLLVLQQLLCGVCGGRQLPRQHGRHRRLVNHKSCHRGAELQRQRARPGHADLGRGQGRADMHQCWPAAARLLGQGAARCVGAGGGAGAEVTGRWARLGGPPRHPGNPPLPQAAGLASKTAKAKRSVQARSNSTTNKLKWCGQGAPTLSAPGTLNGHVYRRWHRMPHPRVPARPSPRRPCTPPTWNGGSHGRFCMTGRLKAAGACTMSKVTPTSTGCAPGSGAATCRRPENAAVSGEPGSRA